MIVTDANLWVALYDDRDALHDTSLAFFRRILPHQIPLIAPAIMPLEVACAVARRSRDMEVARAVAAKLISQPLLSLSPLDAELMELATRTGTECFLRGGGRALCSDGAFNRGQIDYMGS